MALDSIQTGVARGMAIAAGIAVVLFGLAYFLQWPNFSNHAASSSRVKLAALAALLPSATLFICIARLAKHRFVSPQDIQGSALTSGTERARLLQALLQNTLEQCMLAVPIYFAAAVFFPARLLPLVAAAAFMFAVGRALFFSGYGGGAPFRAAGFALTFYPSVALLLIVIAITLLRAAASYGIG